MAQVISWTNLNLPELDAFMKQIVADSTGRQETTICSVVNKLDAFQFGHFDSGIFVQIFYVGTADMYRTQKILQFVTQKLQQKYAVHKLQVYVTFAEMTRYNAFIDAKQL